MSSSPHYQADGAWYVSLKNLTHCGFIWMSGAVTEFIKNLVPPETRPSFSISDQARLSDLTLSLARLDIRLTVLRLVCAC
jgi:hypothetical protein